MIFNNCKIGHLTEQKNEYYKKIYKKYFLRNFAKVFLE